MSTQLKLRIEQMTDKLASAGLQGHDMSAELRKIASTEDLSGNEIRRIAEEANRRVQLGLYKVATDKRFKFKLADGVTIATEASKTAADDSQPTKTSAFHSHLDAIDDAGGDPFAAPMRSDLSQLSLFNRDVDSKIANAAADSSDAELAHKLAQAGLTLEAILKEAEIEELGIKRAAFDAHDRMVQSAMNLVSSGVTLPSLYDAMIAGSSGANSDVSMDDAVKQADALMSLVIAGLKARGLENHKMGFRHNGDPTALSKLDAKALPAGAWIENLAEATDAGTQRCEIQVGMARDLCLRWHSEEITGIITRGISSTSYTELNMEVDGYRADRIDHVSIDGAGLDRLSYALHGGIQIGLVTAQDLSEWAVVEEGGEARLQLVFSKPVTSTILDVRGWTALDPGTPRQAGVLSLRGALRQVGFIGLQHGGGRRFTADSLSGLKRSSNAELASQIRLTRPAAPDRVYRFLEAPVGTGRELAASFSEGRATLTTDVVGVVQPERLLVSVRSRYRVTGAGPLKHEVPLPGSWTIRHVQSANLRSWSVETRGAERHLIVHFKRRAETDTEVLWSAEQALKPPETGVWRLDLPQPRLKPRNAEDQTGIDQERIEWVLAADGALALSHLTEGLDESYRTMRSVPLNQAATWVQLDPAADYRFAFQSARPDSKLAITLTARKSTAHATVVSFVRPAEDHIQVNTRCRVRIEQAGRDRFTLRLPVGAALVSIEAENIRSWNLEKQAAGSVLTVLLQSPVSDEQTIDLSYRLDRKAGKDPVLGPLVLEDAEIQRTEYFVGLLKIEQRLVTVSNQTGLTRRATPSSTSARCSSGCCSRAASWSKRPTATGSATRSSRPPCTRPPSS